MSSRPKPSHDEVILIAVVVPSHESPPPPLLDESEARVEGPGGAVTGLNGEFDSSKARIRPCQECFHQGGAEAEAAMAGVDAESEHPHVPNPSGSEPPKLGASQDGNRAPPVVAGHQIEAVLSGVGGQPGRKLPAEPFGILGNVLRGADHPFAVLGESPLESEDPGEIPSDQRPYLHFEPTSKDLERHGAAEVAPLLLVFFRMMDSTQPSIC